MIPYHTIPHHTTPHHTTLHHTVVTPSHCITAINVWVDAATREELQTDLTWMLCCPTLSCFW